MPKLTRPKKRAEPQSGKLTKAERVANQEADDRHDRARCAIQAATQFLARYYAEHPKLKVINPDGYTVGTPHSATILTADDFPDQETFNE